MGLQELPLTRRKVSRAWLSSWLIAWASALF